MSPGPSHWFRACCGGQVHLCPSKLTTLSLVPVETDSQNKKNRRPVGGRAGPRDTAPASRPPPPCAPRRISPGPHTPPRGRGCGSAAEHCPAQRTPSSSSLPPRGGLQRIARAPQRAVQLSSVSVKKVSGFHLALGVLRDKCDTRRPSHTHTHTRARTCSTPPLFNLK